MIGQQDHWWSSVESLRRVEGWTFIGGSVVIAVMALVAAVVSGEPAPLGILPVCAAVIAVAAWVIRSSVRQRAGEWEHAARHWALVSHQGQPGIPEWVVEWQTDQLLRWALQSGHPDRAVARELEKRLSRRPQYPVPTPVPPLPWTVA